MRNILCSELSKNADQRDPSAISSLLGVKVNCVKMDTGRRQEMREAKDNLSRLASRIIKRILSA